MVAIARRILIELVRQKRSLILWAILPMLVLPVNALILSGIAQLPLAVAFEQAAPATIIGIALPLSSLGGSVVTLVTERRQQTFKRLWLSPLQKDSYMGGVCLAYLGIAVGQTLLIYGLAAFWGAKFTGSILLAGLVLLLTAVTYVGVGFILGTQLIHQFEDVLLIPLVGIPLLVLGGIGLPTQSLPASLQQLAAYNPIYHMNAALTSVSVAGQGFGDPAVHIWVLIGLTALAAGGGLLSYRQMLNREKEW
jgi:ABC-2 type transport system permease protein